MEVSDVEEHLDLVVGDIPEGCDPVSLGGDGRGRMVNAAFDCPGDSKLRIERFDSEANDDELPGEPSVTSSGRVAWRDGSTGDVVRVVSHELDVDVLLDIADSIEVGS